MNFEREWLAHFPKDISKSLLRKRVIGGGNYIGYIIFSVDGKKIPSRS